MACIIQLLLLYLYQKLKQIVMSNWKEMGFKSEKEYTKFLNDKSKGLMDKIKNDPKLLNVFKRLKDK